MEPGIAILLCVVALVLGAGVSGFICFKQGISYRKKTAEAAVGSAEKEAERIVDDAKKNAETLKKRGIDRGERRDPQVTPGNGKRA